MTIQVQAPDGSTVSFPDDMDAAAIHDVMSQHFGGHENASTVGRWAKATWTPPGSGCGMR